MDQIFVTEMILEEYLGKGKKLNATFMDLEKAYDRFDREALVCSQNVWCSYWRRRHYIGRQVYVRMDGELS